MSLRSGPPETQGPSTGPTRVFEKRLNLTLLVLYLVQALYYALLTAIFALPWGRAWIFAAASAGYHALVYAGLGRVRREFKLDPTGEPLRRVNLPLILSLLRLSAVPAVVFLFLSIRRLSTGWVVAPFLLTVFLTDLFDGLLARALNQQSRLGRIVDAAGDYLLIFTLTILYGVFGLVPWWLLVLVLVRLGLQSAGTVSLYYRGGYGSLKLTLLGKASVFATFCLYGFELAQYLEIPLIGRPQFVRVLELVTTAILAASLVEKILVFCRAFRETGRARKL